MQYESFQRLGEEFQKVMEGVFQDFQNKEQVTEYNFTISKFTQRIFKEQNNLLKRIKECWLTFNQ